MAKVVVFRGPRGRIVLTDTITNVDADDAGGSGVLSHVNRPAAKLGLAPGMLLRDALLRVVGAAPEG
jgi:hypothetical protein